jgi:hypothetical protein
LGKNLGEQTRRLETKTRLSSINFAVVSSFLIKTYLVYLDITSMKFILGKKIGMTQVFWQMVSLCLLLKCKLVLAK